MAQRMVRIEQQLPPIYVSAPTIADLAGVLGLPPAAATATIEAYNAALAAGAPDAFGRKARPKAIDTPPFHCIPAIGTIIGTHGGVAVDSGLRVRGPAGTIANLYAVGEVLGKGVIMGDGIASGQAVGPAIGFGMLIGTAAARAD
jgi:fumarate reductase flavoprotein subunit